MVLTATSCLVLTGLSSEACSTERLIPALVPVLASAQGLRQPGA
jgi:hypothetical protein